MAHWRAETLLLFPGHSNYYNYMLQVVKDEGRIYSQRVRIFLYNIIIKTPTVN